MKTLRPILLAAICFTALSPRADEVSVTVYSGNLGVISETRTLPFEKGISRLAFRDVPSQIDASSVQFEIISRSKNAFILEQNYAYDLVSPDQLYDKYIDEQVELIDEEGRLYTGKLLAHNSRAVTLGEESGRVKILSMNKISEVNFPLLPEGLITRPTLFWLYSSDFTGDLECRVGYQTGGMTWTAEYIGVLDEAEKRLELTGWSSIDNRSGKTYADAKLKLVAGDIQRAIKRRPPTILGAEGMSLERAAPPSGFEEKAFFEYHLYTLPRRATLANKEKKQIALFDPAQTQVEKIYKYFPDMGTREVEVAVKFKNSKETGLGMPLPEGRMRTFKADDDGSLILLGEDLIKHTPRDEDLYIKIGKAFDIIGEQTVTSQVRVSDKVQDRHWKIELRNHKDDSIVVQVEKGLGMAQQWEILESSFDYTKKDAGTVTFEVPVLARGKAVLDLKVRFTSR